MTSTLDANTMELSHFRILNALTGILKFLHNVEIDFAIMFCFLARNPSYHLTSLEDFLMEYIKNTTKFCL